MGEAVAMGPAWLCVLLDGQWEARAMLLVSEGIGDETMLLFFTNSAFAVAGLMSLNLVYAAVTPGTFIDNLLSNPLVSNMAVLVALALGGYLLAVLKKMTNRLAVVTNILDTQTETLKVHGLELRDASTIAVRTEALVNSRSAEMRSEIQVLQTKLDAANEASKIAETTTAKNTTQLAPLVLAPDGEPIPVAQEGPVHVIIDPSSGQPAT